jgi:hypothetical protein
MARSNKAYSVSVMLNEYLSKSTPDGVGLRVSLRTFEEVAADDDDVDEAILLFLLLLLFPLADLASFMLCLG